MIELREKRTLNSKHFKVDDNKINGIFHAGHVHYFNKLGVGNSINDFRSIDYTLTFDQTKGGWTFLYHSFHPILPEYADGWVSFRDIFEEKDQVIKYRAHADHIKGRLVMPSDIGIEKETSVNCVIYDNAFGEGMDYILYFTRSTLKKVVRIREKYKGTSEIRLTWDIELPENKIVKRIDSYSESSYILDLGRDKIFDTNKETVIGEDIPNGKENFTHLKPFKVWDSGVEINGDYHEENINVEYSSINKTITKIIPVDFLKISTGDIYTDTTTSYYSGSGDAWMRSNSSSWTNVRNGTNNQGDNTSSSVSDFRISDWYGDIAVYRHHGEYDTSGLGATATITAATLYIYWSNLAAGTFSSHNGWQATQSDATGANVAAWWDSFTAVIANWADEIRLGTGEGYKSWALNSTGLAGINKTGTTKCGVAPYWDIVNQDPNQSGGVKGDNGTAYFSEDTSGTKDPYLSVTYTKPRMVSQVYPIFKRN